MSLFMLEARSARGELISLVEHCEREHNSQTVILRHGARAIEQQKSMTVFNSRPR